MSHGAPIPWIPKSPPGWPIQRAKTVLYRAKVLNRNRDEQQVLSLTLRGVVDNDPENPVGLVPEDYATYQIFEADDLVFKLIDLENVRTSRVGQVPKRGIMSSAYLRLRPRPGVSVRYLYWSFFDLYNRQIFNHLGSGVRSTLGADDVLNLPLLVPDLDTQQAIADYLDTETTRIDDLITKKQRMIELLSERLQAERRRSIADQRGWRLKHLLRAPMAYGILVPQFVDPGSGVRMLRISNLDNAGGVLLSEAVWVPRPLSNEYRRTLVVSGDLVISVVGSMGRSSVISDESEGSNLNRPLARVQLQSDLDPWIMWHWTQTTDFLDQAQLATGGGTAQPTLNLGDLAEFKVGLPADRTEWPKIALNLSEAYAAHLTLTSRLRRQIGLLRERRQALVTAAVTGEFEVPGVAA
jgi:type I restriction enzyme S subunit